MKLSISNLIALSLLTLAGTLRADIVYSNFLDTPIATNYTGTDVTVGSGTLNLFFGGAGVANDANFQPFRTGTGGLDTMRSFAFGDSIGSSSVYLASAGGSGGSTNHLGTQFTVGTDGYLGFKLAGTNYGWMRADFTYAAAGAVVKDWAYDNTTGAAIKVGLIQTDVTAAGLTTTTLNPVTTGDSYTLSSALTNGVASGYTNSVRKIGAGTVTLTGTNTYTGTTTVNAGTLSLDFTALATPTDLINNGSALVLGGGTLSMIAKNTNTSQTFNGTTLNSGGSTISVTPNGAGAVFVLGGIARNAGSTILFSLPPGTQNSGYGVTTTATNTATSILGGWATTGNDWAVTGASGTNNVTALGTYFVKDDVSQWTTYATSSSNMTDTTGYYDNYTNDITLNSLRFQSGSSDSNIRVNAGQTLTLASGGILVGTGVGAKYQRIKEGNLTSSGSELFINQNNNSSGHLEITSAITGSGVSLVKSGIGFLDLQGAASYGGATTLNGGTLQVSGGNDRLPTGTTLTNNNGTFQLANVSQTVAGLAGSATAIVDNAGGTNTLTVNGTGSNTFAGVIKNTAGTLNVTMSGTGTQTLTGTNTYTGATSVNAGKLIVNGSTASGSAVTVAAGVSTGIPVATLGGTGTIGGTVTLAAESIGGYKNGGILAPTASASGTQLKVTGTTTFGAGSIFEFDLNAATTNTRTGETYGQLAGTGTIGGTDAVFKIVLSGNAFTDNFWDTNKTWTNVFTQNSGTTNSLASIFSGGFSGTDVLSDGTVTGRGQFTFNGGTTSTLTWSAVPEPTSALAGLLITAGLLRRRRA